MMTHIASFHLSRERPGRSVVSLARLATDRRPLGQIAGLRFWRLLGTGRAGKTSPSIDPRRSAMFLVWEDEAALDEFEASHPIPQRWAAAEETWSVRLRGIGGHGTWHGYPVLDGLTKGDGDGRIVMITRANVRLRAWKEFSTASRHVDVGLGSAEGLLDVVAIGEAPVGRLGTFSIWESHMAAQTFARDIPAHAEAAGATRRSEWFTEELFASFEPYASSGMWGGRDPLQSV